MSVRLIFFSFLFISKSSGQQKVIVEASKRKAIEFANVVVLKSKKGVISNAKGIVLPDTTGVR